MNVSKVHVRFLCFVVFMCGKLCVVCFCILDISSLRLVLQGENCYSSVCCDTLIKKKPAFKFGNEKLPVYSDISYITFSMYVVYP
jgi:hypothetical protein